MIRIKLFLFILSCLPIAGISQNVQKDSILFEILLGNEMLEPFDGISFINSIDITPEGFILLSSPNQFYLLGIGGIVPLSEKVKIPVSSFIQIPDGVMFVNGKNLCYLDSLGKSAKLFGLPNEGMRIASGTDVIYLYDSDNKQDKYAIYVLFKKAEYLTLLEYPFSITSVLESEEYLFFGTENKLMMADIRNKEVTKIVELPDENTEIISITNDIINNVIYFSTNQVIYRIKNLTVERVFDEFGGILKYDGEGLLIFNAEKNRIIRLRNNILYQ
jgi:hypothetical protein